MTFNHLRVWGTLLGLLLGFSCLFGGLSRAVAPEHSPKYPPKYPTEYRIELATHHDSPNHTREPSQFQRIEQPWGTRLIVTAGGVSLIGLELWWFIFSKSKGSAN
jgi:hypothetical protein